MKARLNKDEKFKSFELTLTFEDQWEAEFIGSLFNFVNFSGEFKEHRILPLAESIYNTMPDQYVHDIDAITKFFKQTNINK